MERVRRVSLADHTREPAHEPRGVQRSLVRASRRGDIDAFTRLFEHYRVALYQACLHRLRNAALAEDAVQETFLKAYENFSRFDMGRRIWPWLVTIADHTCIDLIRRQAKFSPIDEMDEVDVNPETGTAAERHPAGPARHAPDDTFDAIAGAERRAQLERMLRVLPPRQRRALMLFAVEGWSYPEIASAEGISRVAIKSVIWRARATLRKVTEVGALNVLVFPYRALRQRLARARASLDQIRAEGLYAGSLSTVGAGVLALTLAFGGGLPATIVPVSEGVEVEAPTAATARVASRSSSSSAHPIAAHADAPRTPSAAPVAGGSDSVSPIESLHNAADRAVNPTKDATPENTLFSSIVPSPSYQKDHTIYAMGTYPCIQAPCRVLFRSTDGGANWKRLDAKNLSGDRLLLPPTYPADRTIFAVGTSGLQASTNGGASFDTVSPLGGGAAISPAFGAGDRRILIGGPTITEYLVDQKTTKPSSLPVATTGGFASVAFSPAYRPDGTVNLTGRGVILVGAERPDGPTPLTLSRPVVYRCEGSTCSSVSIPAGAATPKLRLSPGFAHDGVVYAFTPDGLFGSADGGRSFERLPVPETAGLTDIVLPPAGSAFPPGSMFLTAWLPSGSTPGGVYRSSDGGRSWHVLSVGMETFNEGARSLAATRSGRLIVGTNRPGIACSADGGTTWSRRCTSE